MGRRARLRASLGAWLRRMGRRHWYGEGSLHLLLMLASFALTGYAGLRLLDGDEWPLVVVWFVGAALVHDLVLLPLYSLADRAVCAATAGAGRHRAWTAYVRVPAVLSGLLLLVWFPLIAGSAGTPAGAAARYELATGLPGEEFLARWLLITAGLFGLSALLLLGGAAAPRLRGAAARARRRRATKRRSAPSGR
ncbi:hypothetical protein [Streptomyces sp. NPDC101150]|uniref:hypothetical protein n=1 Tax=Streptomyces sp. NPDC101150 TaxID=3366114 RepID=UPI0037F178D0